MARQLHYLQVIMPRFYDFNTSFTNLYAILTAPIVIFNGKSNDSSPMNSATLFHGLLSLVNSSSIESPSCVTANFSMYKYRLILALFIVLSMYPFEMSPVIICEVVK